MEVEKMIVYALCHIRNPRRVAALRGFLFFWGRITGEER